MVLGRPVKQDFNLTVNKVKELRELRKEKRSSKTIKGGGIVIMNTSDYEQNMDELLNFKHYWILHKNSIEQFERRVYKCLDKYEHFCQDKLRSRLTPHYSKPQRIYGLLKQDNVPLKPVVNSRFVRCTSWHDRCLIISPLSDGFKYSVKESKHFVNIVRDLVFDNQDVRVSFGVTILFSSVPVRGILNIVKARLERDPSLSGRTNLSFEGIMELLEVCANAVYFQYNRAFYSHQ